MQNSLYLVKIGILSDAPCTDLIRSNNLYAIVMEVTNGIIIDGVLHELAEARGLSLKQQCDNFSLCALCKNEFIGPLCSIAVSGMAIFINRGKVKIEKEE